MVSVGTWAGYFVDGIALAAQAIGPPIHTFFLSVCQQIQNSVANAVV